MKLLQIIVFIFISLSFLSGQNTKLKSSDYDKYYPQYFHAIEDAASGNFSDAVLAFEKMLNHFPTHQEAFLLRTICSDALNRKISLNAAEYLFEGINARYNSDRVDEVIFFFNRAFSEEDNYLPFYLIRGIFFAGINKYEWAHSDLSVAIQLAPKSAICYYNRGKLYFDNKIEIQALHDFNTALELNPQYTAVYIKRAYIYNNINEPDRVLQDFKTAYNIDSTSIRSLENSSLLNNISTVYMEQNNLSAALEALDLSIISDNRWYEPFLNRGIVHKALNKFELAISDLDKAIKLKPHMGKAYYNRGLVYKSKNDFIKAKNDLITSLEYQDTDLKVYYSLAEVYKELEEYNKATEFYKIAITREPENIWTYYQLASLFDKRRGFKDAINYYDEFVKRASNEYFEHKIKAKDRSDRIKKYLNQQNKK